MQVVDSFDLSVLLVGSKFGAMLDMLMDRVGTMTLISCLCVYYPNYLFYLQMSIAIDIASHWLHVHTSIAGGSTSHKAIDLDQNPILHIYYTNRKVLFGVCACNELFYSTLYLCYHTVGPFGIFKQIAYITAPVAILKTLLNLLHLYTASYNLASLDVKDRKDRKVSS
ncbi:hypothetical protein Ciccas_006899 [Cichlidogyrus casuarinus]|uniref:CDP-diacylglycerol--inositol 3-phosphatidyltransferase n=1 Tax=Cichlidogyrus casuarinus TaxID=1844966 RepID=A0ABD2Q6Y2_9PLAT